MKLFRTAFALFALVGALEVAPMKGRVASANASKPTQAQAPSDEAVKALHSKLEKMAVGLQGAMKAMAASKLGPELEKLVSELRAVLKETQGMKDNAAAMKKLLAAREGVSQLTRDLTARQVEIMKDEESQKDSLLLGVLMTRQKEPMAEQLKILRSDDFAMLPVSKALLEKHNSSQPLFGQAAAYLDTHAAKGIAVKMPSEAEREATRNATAARLQKSVDSLQKTYDAREKHHAQREKELKEDVAKATKQNKHKMQALLKREERNFKKWAVMQKHDIDAMKHAVAAVKRGDMAALHQAQAALERSMAALKDKNAGFLVLLSLGNQLMNRDCPYCAAQCVDKCHQEGKPYTQCLTDCADAGK